MARVEHPLRRRLFVLAFVLRRFVDLRLRFITFLVLVVVVETGNFCPAALLSYSMTSVRQLIRLFLVLRTLRRFLRRFAVVRVVEDVRVVVRVLV